MASLRFVHVVCGDDDRRTLVRDSMNLRPKLAAAHRIDARGGLIEKEERRAMDHRAHEREPLFPTSRECATELLSPVGQAGAIELFGDPAAAVPSRHTVDARIESQVFFNRQILVEAEALRHVADVLFDALGVLFDIVTDHGRMAAARVEDPAKYAKRRRFAGAVWAEQPEDLPAVNAEAHVPNRLEIAETAREALDDDGVLHHYLPFFSKAANAGTPA